MLVTIAAQDLPEFQSGDRTPTSGRFYASKDFRTSTGELVIKGSDANPDFYQDVAVSMVGDNLRIAAAIVHSTMDANPSTATYSLAIYDENDALIRIIKKGIRVPSATPTTWLAIDLASASRPQVHAPRFMDDEAIMDLFAEVAAGGLSATELIKGITFLDTAPATPGTPIALGANSPVISGILSDIATLEANQGTGGLPKVSDYEGDIDAAFTALGGADDVTLLVDIPVTTTGVVVPSNIYLQKEAAGTITGPVTFQGYGLRNPLDNRPLFLGASPGDVKWQGAQQVETNIVVAPAGITVSGDAKSVVTSARMSNSPKTVTVPLITTFHTTAERIAASFRAELARDPDVKEVFAVGGIGANITLTERVCNTNDATVNFTIEDVTSAGITDSLSSANTVAGVANSIAWPSAISTGLWDSLNNSLTEKAQCADAALLGKRTQIVAWPGVISGSGLQDLSTVIVIHENHHLYLTHGDYTNTYDGQGDPIPLSPILLDSHTSLTCAPGARVFQSSVAYGLNYGVVGVLSYSNPHGGGGYGEDIVIDGLHIVGHDNQLATADLGMTVVNMGNTHRGILRNCIFEQTRGYVALGGAGGYGNRGDNLVCTDNVFIGCAPQQLAVINATNWVISRCYFDQRSQALGGVYGIIDIEPNGVSDTGYRDIADNGVIENCFFDCRDENAYIYPILAQAIAGGKNLTIRNNTFFTGDFFEDGILWGGKALHQIWAYGFHELYIHNNTFRGGNDNPVHLVHNRDFVVRDNDFIGSVDSSGMYAQIKVVGCNNGSFRNNYFHKTTLPTRTQVQIAAIAEVEWPYPVTVDDTTVSQVYMNGLGWNDFPQNPFFEHLIGGTVSFNGVENTIDSTIVTIPGVNSTLQLENPAGTVTDFVIGPGDISTLNNTFSHTGHGLLTGGKVFMTNTPFSAANFPAHTRPDYNPLFTVIHNYIGSFYYVIRDTDDVFKLAYTAEDAAAGIAIDFTSTGTGNQWIIPIMETRFASHTYVDNQAIDGITLDPNGTSRIISTIDDGRSRDVDSNETVGRGDGVLNCTEAVTLTLEDADTLRGKEYTLINSSDGDVTVLPTGDSYGLSSVGTIPVGGFHKIKADVGKWILQGENAGSSTSEAALPEDRPLFSQLEDATTTDVVEEVLYTNTIPADTLQSGGNMIKFEYSGEFAANANIKHLLVDFAGTRIFDSETFDDIVSNAKDWTISGTILVIDAETVRCKVRLETPDWNPWVEYTEVGSLDLANDDLDLVLSATTLTAAGGATAKMGLGWFETGYPPANFNVALAANGGTATADATLGGSPSDAINGDRAPGVAADYWISDTMPGPRWLEVDFGQKRVISEVVLVGLRETGTDNYTLVPTDNETATVRATVDFRVQTWNGTSWSNRASVSGNNLVRKHVTFDPVRTSKVRVVITFSGWSVAYVVELEAWGY
jgi:hypothetical protein